MEILGQWPSVHSLTLPANPLLERGGGGGGGGGKGGKQGVYCAHSVNNYLDFSILH